jgi:hypothetical protein
MEVLDSKRLGFFDCSGLLEQLVRDVCRNDRRAQTG